MAAHPAQAVGWTKSGVITIPMSATPLHQAQNLAAAEIHLTPEEMARLG